MAHTWSQTLPELLIPGRQARVSSSDHEEEHPTT